MRKTIYTSLLIAICTLVFASCEKTNIASKTYSDSFITPEFETGCNDIFVIDTLIEDISVSANVPVITARDAEIDDYKLTFNPSPFTINEISGGNYKIEVLDRKNYTRDVQRFLIQNYEKNDIVNYYNYGYLEKEINLRVIGKLGTKYIDFRDYTSNIPGENYYVSGTVVEISPSTKTGKEFYRTFNTHKESFAKAYTKGGAYSEKDAAALWGGIVMSDFAAHGKEYATLVIENEDGCFTFDVYGNKKDGDIERLVNYVKPGYYVEVPAYFKEIEDVKDKNFGEIKFNQVLVKIIPQEMK